MPGKAGKAASILWAFLLGGGIIFLIGSILLPSTKRARFDVRDLERMRQEELQREEERIAAAAAIAPATAPATVPSTTNPLAHP